MLKTKPKKVEEIKKVEAKIINQPSPVDLTPMLEKLNNIIKELTVLNTALPNTFKSLEDIVKDLPKQQEEPTKFVEEFKTINDKFFDINLLLTSFVNSQTEIVNLINKDTSSLMKETKTDNIALLALVQQLEETNKLLSIDKPKQNWSGEMNVLRDHNGIYKVVVIGK